MDQSSKIFALKVTDEWKETVYASLKNGEGRFGWSYIDNADLNLLKTRIETNGWNTLSRAEQDCYQPFLLDLNENDYVVYINVPEWGQCTLARVIGPYYWNKVDEDFNHHFKVDPESIKSFDRNDRLVHPALSARLKLLGRYWRIKLIDEFTTLVLSLSGDYQFNPRKPEDNLQLLSEKISPILLTITQAIQHTHPNYNLEHLVAELFKNVPGVLEANVKGGSGDNGADILVRFAEGLPLPGLEKQSNLVVQVKSFVGEHWDTRALEDIRRAFKFYPDVAMGLILSTADKVSPEFEKQLDLIRQELKKPIGLLVGRDVAAFFLRFGPKLLN